ncbi:DUF2516 family protein [Promicromonospora sp. Marseille-Q5078]
MFGALQYFVLGALALVVFVVQLVAFVDAARRPARAYVSEGKLKKNIWLIILGVAAIIGLLGLPPTYMTSTSFFNVIAVTPAIIYWVDVRPKIQPYGTGGGRRPQGPTGGW